MSLRKAYLSSLVGIYLSTCLVGIKRWKAYQSRVKDGISSRDNLSSRSYTTCTYLKNSCTNDIIDSLQVLPSNPPFVDSFDQKPPISNDSKGRGTPNQSSASIPLVNAPGNESHSRMLTHRFKSPLSTPSTISPFYPYNSRGDGFTTDSKLILYTY